LAVDFLGAGPALGRAQDNHRPARALKRTVVSGDALNALDLANGLIQRSRHELVHFWRLIAFDEDRRVAIASEQLVEFLVADPRQYARVGNLVAVEVEDRQHGA